VSVTNNGGSNNSFTISVDTVITLAYADTTTITDATPTFTGTTVGLAPNATHVFNNVSATDEGTYTELSDFSRFTSDDVSLVVNSASITPLSLDGKNPIIGPDILSQATVTVRYTSIPEPGGIMLSLTALLIGLVRRRRRA
jgi:cytochrome c biogenesis factor